MQQLEASALIDAYQRELAATMQRALIAEAMLSQIQGQDTSGTGEGQDQE